MGAVFFQAFFLELLIVSCGSFVLVALIIAPLTEFRQKGFFAGEVFTDRVAEPRKNIAGFRDSGKLSTRILASGAVAENGEPERNQNLSAVVQVYLEPGLCVTQLLCVMRVSNHQRSSKKEEPCASCSHAQSSDQKTVHRPLVQDARRPGFQDGNVLARWYSTDCSLDGSLAPNGSNPAEVDVTARAHGKGPAWPGLRSIPLRGPPRRSDREQRLPTNQTRLRLRARNKSCRRSIELAAVPRRSLSGDGSLSVSTAVTASGVVLERRCNGSKQLAVRRQSSGAPRQGRDGSF